MHRISSYPLNTLLTTLSKFPANHEQAIPAHGLLNWLLPGPCVRILPPAYRLFRAGTPAHPDTWPWPGAGLGPWVSQAALSQAQSPPSTNPPRKWRGGVSTHTARGHTHKTRKCFNCKTNLTEERAGLLRGGRNLILQAIVLSPVPPGGTGPIWPQMGARVL